MRVRAGRATHIFIVAMYLAAVSVILALLFSTFYAESYGNDPEVLGAVDVLPAKYSDAALQETAELINQERAKSGLPKLRQSTELDQIAQERANDMSTHSYYAHKGSDGKFFSDKLKEQGIGYTFACENLNSLFSPSSKKYVSTWLDSPAHKECILKNTHKSAGYAIATIPSINGVPHNQKVIVAIYSNSIE